mmetsp:Transcript_22431/g.76905  ORF Transcript_22431/g.76905 Transcript_22431/m.76905 type:complete len:209 (+) Transcript_22431:488-1114(+)
MTGWSECASSWTGPPPPSGVGAVPPDPLAVVARGRVRLDEPASGEPAVPAPDRAELAEQHRVRHQLVGAGRGLGERRRPLDLRELPLGPPRLLPAALLAQVVDGDEELVVEALLGQRVLERLAERLDAGDVERRQRLLGRGALLVHLVKGFDDFDHDRALAGAVELERGQRRANVEEALRLRGLADEHRRAVEHRRGLDFRLALAELE